MGRFRLEDPRDHSSLPPGQAFSVRKEERRSYGSDANKGIAPEAQVS